MQSAPAAPTAPSLHPTTAAPAAGGPALVLFSQQSKKRTTVDVPHIRFDEAGNIYLSKPALQAMDLHEGSRIVIGYELDSPQDWFILPVSSTDPDGFVLKLRRGVSKASAEPQEYGGSINCKALALHFYETLGKQPANQAFRVVTIPQTISSPAHPHHNRAYPILTAAALK